MSSVRAKGSFAAEVVSGQFGSMEYAADELTVQGLKAFSD